MSNPEKNVKPGDNGYMEYAWGIEEVTVLEVRKRFLRKPLVVAVISSGVSRGTILDNRSYRSFTKSTKQPALSKQ